jgi:polyisoprenoid-binding protein YceI
MTDTTSATAPTRKVDGTEIPAPGTYDLDPSHSHLGFTVRHAMVSKARGRFAEVNGTIHIGDDPRDSSVSVEIPAASIDTRDQQRDDHLRGPDFLDVDRFSALSFRSTSVRPAAGGAWHVEGDLTIRDQTRPVLLEVDFEGGVVDPWGNQRIGFSARAAIDREDFGLTWNQVLEAGGFLVGKKVSIDIEAEATRQQG